MDSRDLVAQLGSEVANRLSSAMDRVVELAETGRIDRSSLRALREEIEHARRAGIMGQQWVRLTSGEVKVLRERLDLTGLLRDVLVQRRRDMESRGTEVRQQFEQAAVVSDPTLLFSLLQSLLDWCFQHAVSRVDLRLDIKSWPSHARLAATFSYVPPDEAPAPPHPGNEKQDTRLSTLSWLLLQQTAQLLALPLRRIDSGGRTQLTIEFPETVAARLEATAGLEGLEADDSGLQSGNSQPLAGRRVLVLAPRREVRNAVREALRPMGLMADIVATLDEALQSCAAALPHALVYEQGAGGEEFDPLREGLLKEMPHMALICIADEGKAFEVLNLGGRQLASVGRAAIMDSLPAALLFELSRYP